MKDGRQSGVLAHLGSLPGLDDRGAIGSKARRFVEFLADAGFSVWQVLPINPCGPYGSPYQSCCGNAGEARFISLEPGDLGFDPGASDRVGIESPDELALLKEAFDRNRSPEQEVAFQSFVTTHAWWLEDYARFRVLKHRFDNRPWVDWPDDFRQRLADAIGALDSQYADALEGYRFQQYLFFRQWGDLHNFAATKGIRLFGDLPMFVAHDSVEVWAHQRCFQLAENGHPLAVSGVPPDYFSADGQRWGTPLYDWKTIEQERFRWWIDRIKHQLALFDLLRLDHFRGFLGAWAIPPEDVTAARGQWQDVPGDAFFRCLQQECSPLPLVAEDLGSITPDVLALRDQMKLPGMNVLQFAFDSDAANPYLPHNHIARSMVSTGTHDNNTSVAWFEELDEHKKNQVLEYSGYMREAMPWPLIRAALASVSFLSVIPLQDWLGLGAGHRLNTPGTIEGNWRWRFEWDWIKPELIEQMRHLNAIYGR